MPRPGPRRDGVALRLSKEEIARVDRLAEQEQTTRSEIIRRAVNAYTRGAEMTSFSDPRPAQYVSRISGAAFIPGTDTPAEPTHAWVLDHVDTANQTATVYRVEHGGYRGDVSEVWPLSDTWFEEPLGD